MKKALLVVSFGTSVPRAHREIEAVEQALAAQAPDRTFFRAYTSPTIRRLLAQRGEQIFDLNSALENLAVQGYEDVAVAVTHLLYGIEYDKIKEQTAAFSKRFSCLRLGPPLLADSGSLCALARCLLQEPLAPGEGLVWMGHGTEHFANMVYPALQTALRLAGGRHAYVGTVEGWPSLEDVLTQLQSDGCSRVLLVPLMLVAGDHAQNDMAGSDPESWKSRLEEAGISVRCRMEGLGALASVQDLYAAHLQKLLQPEEDNGV